jgi:hypothetical protein
MSEKSKSLGVKIEGLISRSIAGADSTTNEGDEIGNLGFKPETEIEKFQGGRKFESEEDRKPRGGAPINEK